MTINHDQRYHWAADAAAQLLNLGHIDDGQPKSIQFAKVADVIYQAIKMNDVETRDKMLRPSRN